MARFRTVAELLTTDGLPTPEHAGAWMAVEADRIAAFADATDDHQWIHLDAARAATGPFGGIVAHGFLTLSMLTPLLRGALEVDDAAVRINYGLDRVRFARAVRAGERVRAVSSLVAVDPAAGGAKATLRVRVEVEGAERPAVVADQLVLISAEGAA